MGFSYVDRHGAESQRRVEPHGIFIRLPFWYVLAIDVEIGAEDSPGRMFRMDRISNPRMLARRFESSLEIIEELIGDVPFEVLAANDRAGL